MIPTHALPPLTYSVPERLSDAVGVGSVVSAHLSGRSRVGVVTSVSPADNDAATEKIRAVSPDVSLPAGIVHVCERVAASSALSLASVLRAALPPGMKSDRYAVVSPGSSRDRTAGETVTRRDLRAALGDEGFKRAESGGRFVLVPGLPEPRTSEWAVQTADPDLSRAPRQREMLDVLKRLGGETPVTELLASLASGGGTRATLRALVKRGAVELEDRESRGFLKTVGETLHTADGTHEPLELADGVWVSRTPRGETYRAVGDFALAVLGRGRRFLVLAPEVSAVREVSGWLASRLPAGTVISELHSSVAERAGVWRAARNGETDVLVGTRSAAMFPVRDLGGICVLDEPNAAHRAAPGHEGLQVHVRDIVRTRSAIEGIPAHFLSPHPSLRLYSGVSDGEVKETGLRWDDPWPRVRLVDMRESGASISSEAITLCRDALESGKTVGVVASRLGYATSVSCRACGAVVLCPRCDLPLSVQSESRLACGGCGLQRDYRPECPECGSSRMSPSGLAVERLREHLAARLDAPVGTPVGVSGAGGTEDRESRVVVGTARAITARRWDFTVVPDADAFFSAGWMSAVERAFRTVYGCAEATRELLLVQTRNPDHHALRAALKGDYPTFSREELARLRSLGYPPFAHLASLTFSGRKVSSGAVESLLQELAGKLDDVTLTEPVRVDTPGRQRAWRVLIRSEQLESVARAGLAVARGVAKRKSSGVVVTVEVDPEEV